MAGTKKAPAASRRETSTITELPLVHPADTPEIYIDGFQGAIVRAGVAKLNLYSDFQELTRNRVERRVVAHLTMPLPVLVSVHETLGELIATLKRDKLIPQVNE